MPSRLIGNKLAARDVAKKSHYPTANTAAVITLAATVDRCWIVHKVFLSYSAAPTGGKLTITDGTFTVDVDIIVGGLQAVDFEFPGLVNTDVVITLSAPGGVIVGKLSAFCSLSAE